MKYTIVVYKPYSDEYCLGCLMNTYDSDFDIQSFDNEEKAAKFLSEYMFRNTLMDRFEDGYEHYIINGDICESESIDRTARCICDEKVKEYKRKVAKQKAQEEKEAQEVKENEERKLYKKLNAKYGHEN